MEIAQIRYICIYQFRIMLLNGRKTILCLAPHPDDIEFSCGATVKTWSEDHDIHYVSFSPCNKSLPEDKQDILYQELRKSIAHLGIKEENLHTFDFPVRDFPQFRQDILEELIVLKKQLKPDIVLLPNSKDIHQDHHVIYEEGLRAFKHSTILGYELPWNSLEYKSNFHVEITPEAIDAKWRAICEYESQSHRSYTDMDFFIGLARVRGIQVGKDFAESFEAVRCIL